MGAKCAAITRAGRPCPSPPLAGSAWCWTHDPGAAEARREASRKGGAARSNRERAKKQVPEAMTAGELASWLSALFRSVLGGKTEPRVATAAATVARILFEVKTTVDVRSLAEQVDELRALVERGERGRAA